MIDGSSNGHLRRHRHRRRRRPRAKVEKPNKLRGKLSSPLLRSSGRTNRTRLCPFISSSQSMKMTKGIKDLGATTIEKAA
jgi:hypothetical protein